MTITKTIIVLVAIAAVVIFGGYISDDQGGGGAPQPSVTPADYAAVRAGMTVAQVNAIMGPDNGFVGSEEPAATPPHAQCMFFAFGSSVSGWYDVCFVHGRVSSKATQNIGPIAG